MAPMIYKLTLEDGRATYFNSINEDSARHFARWFCRARVKGAPDHSVIKADAEGRDAWRKAYARASWHKCVLMTPAASKSAG